MWTQKHDEDRVGDGGRIEGRNQVGRGGQGDMTSPKGRQIRDRVKG